MLSVIIAQLSPASTIEEPPLRIVEKRIGEASTWGQPEAVDIHLTVLNESQKVMTAYRLSCVVAQNSGEFSIAGVEAETFLELEDGSPDPGATDGPIAPGAVREFLFQRPAWNTADPYSTISCGVEAAIFEDSSSWGVPSTVAHLFEKRQGYADELMEVMVQIRRLIENEEARPSSLRVSPENSFADALEQALLRSDDSLHLAAIMEELESRLTFIKKHLSKADIGKPDSQREESNV